MPAKNDPRPAFNFCINPTVAYKIPSCLLPLCSSTSSAISPTIESLTIIPITFNVIRKTRKKLIKNTNSNEPFSGVKPKLYIKNAAGENKPTPAIAINTIVRFSKILTILGVIKNANRVAIR